MSEEIEIINLSESTLTSVMFNCPHCSHPIVKTLDTDDMIRLVVCNQCGRATLNQTILTTSINERIKKHVLYGKGDR